MVYDGEHLKLINLSRIDQTPHAFTDNSLKGHRSGIRNLVISIRYVRNMLRVLGLKAARARHLVAREVVLKNYTRYQLAVFCIR